jgi:predicted Zn-dependent protease
MGLLLWKRSKLEEAAEHFQLAVDRDPADTESQTMLTRCQKKQGPRPQDRMDFRERLKTGYEETAWLQLKSMLQPGSRE